jgi:mannosyl-3-phosphoglycerate phosphatase
MVMRLISEQRVEAAPENFEREKWIVVSDLDGSLLDHYSYSSEDARPALDLLRQLDLPLILNTSKTLRETLDIASEIGIRSPLIVENGGGVFIPNKSATGKYWAAENEFLRRKEWIPVGARRTDILKTLKHLKFGRDLKFTSFDEMTLQELEIHTGLPKSSLHAALDREFSEPLLWKDSQTNLDWLSSKLEKAGLRIVKGGRFHVVSGKHNKGTSLDWIRSFFKTSMSSHVKIIALGDGMNDLPMLEAADIAICIRSHANPPLKSNQKTISTSIKTGVEGWNESVLSHLRMLQADPSPATH